MVGQSPPEYQLAEVQVVGNKDSALLLGNG